MHSSPVWPGATVWPVTGSTIFTSVRGSGRPTVVARSSAESSARVIVMPGDASVWAKITENGTPSDDSTRRISSGATEAPPASAIRTDVSRAGSKSAWPSSATSMVGTPPNRSCARPRTSSSTSAGS